MHNLTQRLVNPLIQFGKASYDFVIIDEDDDIFYRDSVSFPDDISESELDAFCDNKLREIETLKIEVNEVIEEIRIEDLEIGILVIDKKEEIE